MCECCLHVIIGTGMPYAKPSTHCATVCLRINSPSRFSVSNLATDTQPQPLHHSPPAVSSPSIGDL
ncbi:hypothetical protein LIA77_02649 [Sarocladium implicatum]|nr:hypothetical protein LIA77_02649 [Sarocladium implicatum]